MRQTLLSLVFAVACAGVGGCGPSSPPNDPPPPPEDSGADKMKVDRPVAPPKE